MPTENTPLYIPPHGLQFRIWGYSSEQVIFSRTNNELQVGVWLASPVERDQWFTLIYGTGDNKGLYAIKGIHSGKLLFSSSVDPRVGHVDRAGSHKDSWFKFERGSGQLSKYFRIITPSNGYALVSRTHVEPHYINNPSSEIYPDQHFDFLYEDMQIDSVHYDVDSGKISPSKPLVLTSQKVANDSSSVQETTVTVNQTTTHTSSFEYTLGFKIAAETEFEAGLPLVAEAKVKISAEVSGQWKWGKVDSTSFAYTAQFPVKVQPGEAVKVSATVSSGSLTVPFTVHLSSKSTGVKTETKGIWRGVTTWDLSVHYEKISK